MPTISTDNITKRSPRWLRKLTRVVNIGLIPVAVTTIKGVWLGNENELNRILLILTITIPGTLELLKILTAEEEPEN